ncbi:hypothetical protein GCM10022223_31210 [Kineosporia mesophila]|uniref:Uncharacterized protein n=1 Tax=Kineosporia mesophila TaxID=566012 RepID=A0ABP6ZMV6_9ACTN|nr:hypothetical protein [Kineosporia mesophila]MCD5349468.1 hypothetical protein [Kineosporia mesophila]
MTTSMMILDEVVSEELVVGDAGLGGADISGSAGFRGLAEEVGKEGYVREVRGRGGGKR